MLFHHGWLSTCTNLGLVGLYFLFSFYMPVFIRRLLLTLAARGSTNAQSNVPVTRRIREEAVMVRTLRRKNNRSHGLIVFSPECPVLHRCFAESRKTKKKQVP